jgi:hypothetical protein
VLDGLGERLGHLVALYTDAETDAETDAVAFAGVAMVRRGRRRVVFAPLDGAVISQHAITLRCGKQLVRRAPSVQAGRPLPADAEPALFAHYEMLFTPATTAGRRLILAD